MPRYALVGVVSLGLFAFTAPVFAQDGHRGESHAENHDWYQELKQPGTGLSCCNGTVNGVEGDCRPTRAYLGTRHPGQMSRLRAGLTQSSRGR